jgi:membrane associated rhomboid family serine protease
MSFVVKILLWTNVVAFVVGWVVPVFGYYLGLEPVNVIGRYWLWQPTTYMFIHAGPLHILFNMLALWWFGVELERLWGAKFFTRFYFVSGVAGAVLTLLLSVLPFSFSMPLFYAPTVGASGAIFGLLLAYAMYFPDRPIYLYFLFPIPARYFVMIMAALSLFTSGTSWSAHFGGLAGGYLFLKFGRARPLAEFKYRYFKWKMNRMRRKFDVYSGGKAKDWDRHVH